MNVEFDEHAFEDLRYWVNVDVKKAKRILTLIEEVRRTPFTGTGKPEPLKYQLSKCWSRRIDSCHRLVYTVTDQTLRVLACRYHY
jgi:toxin YoeB